ncbi:MAG: hypothetical protein ACJAZP_002987 [Psychromonas sp.]|jgi:hypothetical protein|uniref:hypothetical protein n=1 Tax=Psychromonas sp. TaxID=1884585 RepID=UPI0039E52482
MHKIINVKLTSIFSPICQTLLQEDDQKLKTQIQDKDLNNGTELLLIRLDGTIIGYATFDLVDHIYVHINSIHFRKMIKDHALAEYWLSRQLKRHLRKNTYINIKLARQYIC